MKKLLFISCLFSIWSTSLQSQTTYPVDSCLYFMAPTDFLIRGTRTIGSNSQDNLIVFRSSGGGSTRFSYSGRGSFIIDRSDLPAGVDLNKSTTGTLLLTIEAPPEESGDWPGGAFSYPSLIVGFLETAAGRRLEPPLSVTIQVMDFDFQNY